MFQKSFHFQDFFCLTKILPLLIILFEYKFSQEKQHIMMIPLQKRNKWMLFHTKNRYLDKLQLGTDRQKTEERMTKRYKDGM